MAKVLKVGGFDVLESDKKLSLAEAVSWPDQANADQVGGFTDWVLPDRLTLTAMALLKPHPDAKWSSSRAKWSDRRLVSFENGNTFNEHAASKSSAVLLRKGQLRDICRKGHIQSIMRAAHCESQTLPEVQGANAFDVSLLKIVGFDVLEVNSMLDFLAAMDLSKKINYQAVGGIDDWVLPDTFTLRALSILDSMNEFFWSSSPNNIGYPKCGIVDFEFGNEFFRDASEKLKLRLLRAEQLLEIGRAGQLESMRQAGIQLPEENP